MLWTYRDIRSRLRDPLIRVLAVLIVALLFLPGIVVYLILRPQRTLEEEYQHTLEEEALLPVDRGKPTLSGLRAAHPRCLVGLPKLPHQAQESPATNAAS